MNTYYRVIKDNFLWEVGAILEKSPNNSKCGYGYEPIEDIWNICPEVAEEYISADIVENPANNAFFERVYQDSLKGNFYRTADQMKTLYKKAFEK